MKKSTHVIGVWGGHDYGISHGDISFLKKDLMRDIYLDFIGEGIDTPRRLEEGTGIFQDYVITQEGLKIHTILVDVRYSYDS